MILNSSSGLRTAFTVAIAIVASSLVLAATSEEARDLKAKIHNKDYSIAKAAVMEAAHQQNMDLVCENLRHSSLQIRLIAVGAILEIDKAEAVQPLLDALRANQAKYTGGSETEALQNELNSKIIAALQQLTKLHLNEKDIPRTIDDIETWIKLKKSADEERLGISPDPGGPVI